MPSTSDISIKPDELALIQQRTRLIEHMRQFAVQNPLGVLELRKYWRPTSSTKGDWSKVGKEVNGDTAARSQVRFSYVTQQNIENDVRTTSAMAFIFNDEGKMLVVFHKQRGFDIPGGHIAGVREGRIITETPQQAVAREVYEETGFSSLKAKDFFPIGAMHSNDPRYGGNSYMRAYTARLDNSSPSLAYKSPEIAGCCWMHPKDFLMCHSGMGNDIMRQMVEEGLRQVFPDRPLSLLTYDWGIPRKSNT